MTWTVTIPITPAGSRKQTAAHDVTRSGYSAEPATAERLDKATHIRKLGRRRWDRRRKLCPAEPTELCPAEQRERERERWREPQCEIRPKKVGQKEEAMPR